jgi:CheY-like chemotaxis protein
VSAARRVLIVDDDRLVRAKVKSMLESQGMEVWATDDWSEIAKVVAGQAIDVILMDVEMPSLGGDRIAQILLKRLDRTVILLHSSLEPVALMAKVREVGAHGYIPKGMKAVEYAAKIENALAAAGL